MNKRASLLLVDDDKHILESMAGWLREQGYVVETANSRASAVAALEKKPFEIALCDIQLDDGDGFEILTWARKNRPETTVILLTGYGSVATALEAIRLGAVHYLTKPADADDIVAAFSRDSHARIPDAAALQPMSLDRVEWEHINRVLVDCDHNISEAARALGIHRRSLQRKLTKYPPGR